MRVTIASLGTGIGLGLASRLIDHAPGDLDWVGNLLAPWLLLALWVGARSRTERGAGVLGAASLIAGNLSYYAYKRFVEHGLSMSWFVGVGVPWVLIALFTGSLSAWVGRRFVAAGRSVAPICVGVLVGEGVALAAATGRLDALVFEGAAAIPFLMSMRPRSLVVVQSSIAMFALTITSQLVQGLGGAVVRIVLRASRHYGG